MISVERFQAARWFVMASTSIAAVEALPWTAPEKIAAGHDVTVAPVELQLLLACARRQLGQVDRSGIHRLLTNPTLNWDRVLAAAQDHGLIPLLSSHLLNDFPDALPETVVARLRSAFQDSAEQSLLLAGDLVRVVRLLAVAGVRTLAYKGPALALLLHGNIGLRQFCDVDILIRRSDFRLAKKVLLKSGYDALLPVPPAHESSYLTAGCEMPFSNPDTNALVELQWQLVPQYFSIDFEIDQFFRRAQRIKLGGSEVETLSPEDLALVLLVHGAKHCWARLSWVLDLAALVQSNGVDWAVVSERAQRLRIKRVAAVGLGVASSLLAVPPPNGLASSISRDAHFVRSMCENALRESPKLGTREKEPLDYFVLQARLRERFRDRIRFFLRLAFTPSLGEWQKISLPSILFPLYFPIRLVRIAKALLAAAVHQ